MSRPDTVVAVRPTPEDARHWLARDFGITVADLAETEGGADPAAVVWRVVDVDGAVWAAKWTTRRTRTGTRLVAAITATGLDGVPAARLTTDGDARSRRRGGRLSVTRWSDGQDAATVGLDLDGWRRYGELLAAVHAHSGQEPDQRRGARRGIRRRRRPYRAQLRALDAQAADPTPPDDDVRRVVLDAWREARPRIALLSRGARLPSAPGAAPVPCHGDPHLGNVLVGPDGALRLIDWDEAVVAPRELDLHLVEFSVLFRPTGADELAAFRTGYGPVDLDETLLVRSASVRALEDLTSSAEAALTGTAADRAEGLRVFLGVLSPVGSASLVEPRLRAVLGAADAR
ncbi:spectinomycin phosphotransferase [Curtobacterium flaccumfaciens]|uniref:Spectinomycin phosphotransferase n=1 Tax=Curtobacterium salicis TaxID=1779862 RepID=A0ABX0TBF2_9MICO|nr:phosphotransferase [Curtobacterium sp. WW7]NII41105.1 spectinomycin phosphotransferase [Curtobacterium sp. WW7]